MQSNHLQELRMKSLSSEKRLDAIEMILKQSNEGEISGQGSKKSYSNLRSLPVDSLINPLNTQNVPLIGIKPKLVSAKPKTDEKKKLNLSESSLTSSRSQEPISSQESVQKIDTFAHSVAEQIEYNNTQNQQQKSNKKVNFIKKNGSMSNNGDHKHYVNDKTYHVSSKKISEGKKSLIKQIVKVGSAKVSHRHNQTTHQFSNKIPVQILSCKNVCKVSCQPILESNSQQSDSFVEDQQIKKETFQFQPQQNLTQQEQAKILSKKKKRAMKKSKTINSEALSQIQSNSNQNGQKSQNSLYQTPESLNKINSFMLDESSPHQDRQLKYQKFIAELQKEMKDLKSQAHSSKLFLNMVVHDMRNPTKSIKMGLQTTISKLRDLVKIHEDQVGFEESCLQLSKSIGQNIKNNMSQQDIFHRNHQGVACRVQLLIDHVENNFKSFNLEHAEIQVLNQGMSDQIKQILNDISAVYEEPQILDESFEDFDQDQTDEFSDQNNHEQGSQIIENIGRNQFTSNIEKLEQMNSDKKVNQSQLLIDKQSKLSKVLADLLKSFPNSSDDTEKSNLIQNFVVQYYFNQDNNNIIDASKNAQKVESVDFSQQVDFDFQTRNKAERLDSLKQSLQDLQINQHFFVEKLNFQKESRSHHKSMIANQLQTLSLQTTEQLKFQEIMKQQLLIKSKFYTQSFVTINQKAKDAENVLQQQMFSQQMMENLINDLLDLAKMQNNSFQLTNDYFSLSCVIYEAFQMLMHSANEKGIELRAEIDLKANLELIEAIHGDQNRILQIMLNFLSNSLKFTDRGGSITVKIEILGQQSVMQKQESSKKKIENFSHLAIRAASNKNLIQNIKNKNQIEEQDNILNKTIKQEYLKKFKKIYLNEEKLDQNTPRIYQQGQEKFLEIKISVVDTGIGISKEGLKKLFIDFGKLEENQTRNRQGTGLGLSICKQIIEQMGGSVEVKSELGQGTEFNINIKTKCKVQEVQFSESLAQNEFESPQTLLSRRQIEREKLNFFKFIEKTKDKLTLTSCMDEQIKKNRSTENESQIEQLSKFENRNNSNQCDFKNDIEKLIAEAKNIKNYELAKSNSNVGVNQRFDSFNPEFLQNDSIAIASKSSEQIIQEQPPQASSLIDPSHQQEEVEIIASQSAPNLLIATTSAQGTQKKSKMDKKSSFSFRDLLGNKSESNLSSQQISNENSAQGESQSQIEASDVKDGGPEGAKKRYKKRVRQDLKKIDVLEESNEIFQSDVEEADEFEEYSDSETSSQENRQLKCLIANDEPMQLYMLQVIFQMNNFDVTIAQNGHEAFEEVQNSFRKDSQDSKKPNKNQQLFDLIVLDLNMPISDGYETCKNIVNLYNDNNKIFKTNSQAKSRAHVEKLDEVSDFYANDQMEVKQSNLHDKDLMPIILAVTSEIINDDLMKTLSDLGFASAFEAPIKDAIIKNQIIPQLFERRLRLKEKNHFLNIIKESIDNIEQEIDDNFSCLSVSPLAKSMSMMNIQRFMMNQMSNKNSKKDVQVSADRKKSSQHVTAKKLQFQQVSKKINGKPQERQLKTNNDNNIHMKTPTFNCDKNAQDGNQFLKKPFFQMSLEFQKPPISQASQLPCFANRQLEESKSEIIGIDQGFDSFKNIEVMFNKEEQNELQNRENENVFNLSCLQPIDLEESVSSNQSSRNSRLLQFNQSQPRLKQNVLPESNNRSSLSQSEESKQQSSQMGQRHVLFGDNIPEQPNSSDPPVLNQLNSLKFGEFNFKNSSDQNKFKTEERSQDDSPPMIVRQEPAPVQAPVPTDNQHNLFEYFKSSNSGSSHSLNSKY